MASIDVEILRNEFPTIAAQFHAIVNRALRKQMFVSVTDVKINIVKYNYIDTGNALGSVNGKMLSDNEAMVSVSAESKDGYPYPWIGNYGGRNRPPRPFFTEAEMKAEREFPERMRREFEAAMP